MVWYCCELPFSNDALPQPIYACVFSLRDNSLTWTCLFVYLNLNLFIFDSACRHRVALSNLVANRHMWRQAQYLQFHIYGCLLHKWTQSEQFIIIKNFPNMCLFTKFSTNVGCFHLQKMCKKCAKNVATIMPLSPHLWQL